MKICRLTLSLLALGACHEMRAVAPTAQEPPPRDEIHGRVLRADGTPVAGAQVQLTRMEGLEDRSGREVARSEPHGEAVATVVSAANGSFRFTGPLRGSHRLDVTSDEVQHRFGVPAGDFVEFIQGSGCRIEGQLNCADHEQEFFSGEVWLEDGYGGVRLLATPILADGSFNFDSLPPRQYQIAAQVDGHFVYHQMGGVRPVAAGETVQAEVHVTAGRSVDVAGRVLDRRTSAPIEGAKVYSSELEQVTDQEGRFRFQETLSTNNLQHTVRLDATASGFERGTARFDLKSECLIQLEASWPLVMNIRGILVDAAGKPAAGTDISAFYVERYYETTSDYQKSTVADVQGAFTIPWPDDREASLLIQTFDRKLYRLYLGSLPAVAPVREIRLPALSVWNLRLQDDSGNPVAGVELGRDKSRLSARPAREGEAPATHAEFIESRVTSDSFGRCQFVTDATVPPTVGIFFRWGHHWVFPLPPADGGEHVLTLDNLRRVPVRVLTADRQPAEDFFLLVLDAEHPMPDFGETQGGASDVSNLFPSAAGGMAYVEGKFQREVSIVIQAMFVPEYRQDGVALDAGPIEIVLPWTATCTGRVVDADGKAVSAATLLLIDKGKETACAETDADGNFSVTLQKGKFYALVAVDSSGRRSEPVGAGTNTSDLLLRIKD